VTPQLILRLDGSDYRLARLPGPVWRLYGANSRCPYDVYRAAGQVECTCPDFTHRHRGKGTLCKHAAALESLGLLDGEAEVPDAEIAKNEELCLHEGLQADRSAAQE
jgi:SWIM zinc finger